MRAPPGLTQGAWGQIWGRPVARLLVRGAGPPIRRARGLARPEVVGARRRRRVGGRALAVDDVLHLGQRHDDVDAAAVRLEDERRTVVREVQRPSTAAAPSVPPSNLPPPPACTARTAASCSGAGAAAATGGGATARAAASAAQCSQAAPPRPTSRRRAAAPGWRARRRRRLDADAGLAARRLEVTDERPATDDPARDGALAAAAAAGARGLLSE